MVNTKIYRKLQNFLDEKIAEAEASSEHIKQTWYQVLWLKFLLLAKLMINAHKQRQLLEFTLLMGVIYFKRYYHLTQLLKLALEHFLCGSSS